MFHHRKQPVNEKERPRRARKTKDEAFVRILVDKAFRLKQGAYQHDPALFKEIEDLLLGIWTIHDLLDAFQKSPDGKIGGPHGVASQLNLTRNGVYFRLDTVGLDPVDFCTPHAYLGGLLKQSRPLRHLVEKVHKLKLPKNVEEEVLV